jgi:hypothetical protein
MFSQSKTILRDLGDGLVMRRSTPEDAQALAEFNAKIHGEDEVDAQRLVSWTRDLLTRPHPTVRANDFTIIEETSTGRIVSSMNLIAQTWTYEGIEFRVGRPELVGTLPEFRNRGLIRAQFEEIHTWSATRGDQAQAITGIPFYYRLFGYEMALDFAGRRVGYEMNVPKLQPGASEPYVIRPATEADLSFLAEVYKYSCARSMIACVRTPEILRYELSGRSEDNLNHFLIRIIEDREGIPVGYLQHPNILGPKGLTLQAYELKPGVSWLDVTPTVIRYLWTQGQEYARREAKTCTGYCLFLGAQHPAYEVLGKELPSIFDPYAWYLRVPDLPGFLHHIKPALETRLAGSIAAGHSQEITISFYREGLRLVLDQGRLTTIEPWRPTPEDGGMVAFPGLTFLQLLFGYRSYDELEYVFADCWCDRQDIRVLINILFPKKPSNVYPVA